ncbi:uncharacterized protein LOC129755670 [Uranotaenia lowii]|uniref:uncharacterized protein LOC129755670 n=1 Tax=Uranotaenia lowii TaxID=190385 RepID=UPI002478877A|nr:uncharacterized protein LOC129755670 [Uranotaenia lowii]
MALKFQITRLSVNVSLSCLAVAVLAALMISQPQPALASINDNEAQITPKIVNHGSGFQHQQQQHQSDVPRSSILDNIFNIPIQTLKAVNNLVQSIAGNLQAAGSGSYFRQPHDHARSEAHSSTTEDSNTVKRHHKN